MGSVVTGNPIAEKIADKVTSDLSDKDPNKINKDAQNTHFQFYPAGTSFQAIDHFRQMLQNGLFRKYDNN